MNQSIFLRFPPRDHFQADRLSENDRARPTPKSYDRKLFGVKALRKMLWFSRREWELCSASDRSVAQFKRSSESVLSLIGDRDVAKDPLVQYVGYEW